jgi:hypothetical protein
MEHYYNKSSKFASRKRTLLLNRHKSRGGEKHPQPFVRREDCKSYFSAYYDILSKHNRTGHCLIGYRFCVLANCCMLYTN